MNRIKLAELKVNMQQDLHNIPDEVMISTKSGVPLISGIALIKTIEYWMDQVVKELESAHAEQIESALKAERERIKSVILQRTGVPKDARNPKRDATVLLGEGLCDLIEPQAENSEPQPN